METVERVYLSVAVVLFDMKMHSNSTVNKFKRSWSLGDLDQRSLISLLPRSPKALVSETTGPISFTFHKQPLGKGLR